MKKSQKEISQNEIVKESRTYANYRLPVYFAVFMLAFVYWEVLMRMEITGTINRSNIGLLFFIPAEAMLLAAFCGVHRNHVVINKIVSVILAFIPALYYATQFIYYRIFGSVISVSMLGMGGEAIGNFGWALKGVILSSLGYLGLIFLPLTLLFSSTYPYRNCSMLTPRNI